MRFFFSLAICFIYKVHPCRRAIAEWFVCTHLEEIDSYRYGSSIMLHMKKIILNIFFSLDYSYFVLHIFWIHARTIFLSER